MIKKFNLVAIFIALSLSGLYAGEPETGIFQKKEVKPLMNLKKESLRSNMSGYDNDGEKPKLVIKLNIPQLAIANISGQVEYALHKHLSAAIGMSYLVPRKIPEMIFPDNTTGEVLAFLEPKFKAFSITPELRYYPAVKDGNQAPHGFYIAPYMRYTKFTISAEYNTKVLNRNINFDYNMVCKGATFGVMWGVQWIFGKHVSLDWWIYGSGNGIGVATAKMKSSSVTLSSAEQQDVKNHLLSDLGGIEGPPTDGEDTPLFGLRKPVVTTTSNSAEVSIKGIPFYSLRGMGLCLGIAF